MLGGCLHTHELQVTKLLVGPIQEYTDKPGFRYCNVLLIVDESKPPLLLPYFYEEREDNALNHWYFINASLECAFHHIEQFEDV